MLSNMEELDEDIEVRNVNVKTDRIHIVMVLLLRVSVTNTVKYLKSVSGAKLRQKFEFIRKAMCMEEVGYGQGDIVCLW